MRKCRICKGEEFKEVLDMGECPLVNSLVEKKDLKKKEKTYPLVVHQCQKCGLVQVKDPIDSEKIYRDTDYLYFSGDMPGLSEYFEEYAEEIKARFLSIGDFVLEIGSNDGTMLEHFRDFARLGVDPSTYPAIRALNQGIPTLSEPFTEHHAENIKRFWGKAKVIYANNCIAHIDDLNDVMRGVSTLLRRDGYFIIECNYWKGMVDNVNYSLIYHDHFSYFTLKDWVFYAPEFELNVFDAVVTPAQGGSLRVFMNKKENKRALTKRFSTLSEEEILEGTTNYKTCERYRVQVLQKAEDLGNRIKELKKEGKTIAGYGAAAKGFSILKLAGLDERHIDFFVDDSPAKQGKFTPVSHIPVVARDSKPDPDVFIITAPNYADVIKAKEKDFKGQFITP